MASASTKRVIYAALIGNSLIAVTKFAAASFTGSAAMLSEAVHSLVDTGNQLLMLYGVCRAARPADTAHPFGYAMELYFWTFVVAILIFAGGASVSIYQGVDKIGNPHAVTNVAVNYAVLGLAMIFEAVAWVIAYREFRRIEGRRGIFNAVRRSKDPTVFTVLFEDTAAMAGLIVAVIGLYLAEALDMPVLDGVASIAIGVILALTAALLAYECKGLLIGEGAHPETVRGIEEIVDADPRIKQTNEILNMHLGPTDVLLNLSLDSTGDIDADSVEAAISELEIEIKCRFPEINRIFIEAQSVAGHRRALRSARTGDTPEG